MEKYDCLAASVKLFRSLTLEACSESGPLGREEFTRYRVYEAINRAGGKYILNGTRS